MRKLKLQELGRKTVEEYKASDKIPLVVVCDNIRSGMNVGSIFRTCDSFAVERLYLTGISPVPPNKEINKTAIGAMDAVDYQYFETTKEAINHLQKEGFKIVIIEQTTDSQPLSEYSNNWGKVAIVLGNEVNGVSEEILEDIDLAVEIPQYGTKHSLNVAVCAGIIIHSFSEHLRINS